MIKLKVNAQHIVIVKNDVLTTGSVGESCEFIFSEDWSGLGKTAIFTAGEVSRAVAVYEDKCVVPWECLTVPYIPLTIAVYGAKDGKRVIATEYCEIQIKEGAETDADEEDLDPTLPYWAQLQAKLGTIKGVYVGAEEPEDKDMLWVDTSDNGENSAIAFNMANGCYGYRDNDFGWDVTVSNDIYTMSKGFKFTSLKTDDGETVPSMPQGKYGPFYKMLPIPCDPSTLEVAGSMTNGGGYITNTGSGIDENNDKGGQFVRFSCVFPADGDDDVSNDMVHIIVRGCRAQFRPVSEMPVWSRYQNAVKAVIDSWMATRTGKYADGTATDMRHYWYGKNWTYGDGRKDQINVWYERHENGDSSKPVVYREYCPAMECDTFALMCLCLCSYEASPYALADESGGERKWHHRYGGDDASGTEQKLSTWNPFDEEHQDPIARTDGTGTYNKLDKLKKYTMHQFNNPVTYASREAFFLWDYRYVYGNDLSKAKTGDLIFFRRSKPDEGYEWYDNVTHVGVLTVEDVEVKDEYGNVKLRESNALVLNHVTDYTQNYDIDGIVTDTCLHRVLLRDFLNAVGYTKNNYYLARPYYA